VETNPALGRAGARWPIQAIRAASETRPEAAGVDAPISGGDYLADRARHSNVHRRSQHNSDFLTNLYKEGHATTFPGCPACDIVAYRRHGRRSGHEEEP
jgi:hypothetical protein